MPKREDEAAFGIRLQSLMLFSFLPLLFIIVRTTDGRTEGRNSHSSLHLHSNRVPPAVLLPASVAIHAYWQLAASGVLDGLAHSRFSLPYFLMKMLQN